MILKYCNSVFNCSIHHLYHPSSISPRTHTHITYMSVSTSAQLPYSCQQLSIYGPPRPPPSSQRHDIDPQTRLLSPFPLSQLALAYEIIRRDLQHHGHPHPARHVQPWNPLWRAHSLPPRRRTT